MLLLPLIFAGCTPDSLNLKIRFDQVHGLLKGDRVLFEHNPVGMVTNVTYTDGGDYEVAVVIQKDFAGIATEYSRFYIIDDPNSERHKGIEITQARTGGKPLKNLATIEGSTKASVFLEKMVGGFEKGFEEIEKGFERFVKELSRVPESEAYKNLEGQLKELSEEMKRSGNEAREKIEKQWLPQIEKELKKLKERLRKMGREQELKPLETEFKKIKTSL